MAVSAPRMSDIGKPIRKIKVKPEPIKAPVPEPEKEPATT